MLKAIREVTFKFESQRYQALQTYKLNIKFSNLTQNKFMSNSDYLEKFNNHVEAMDACDCTIGFSKSMVNIILASGQPTLSVKTATAIEYQAALDEARDKYLAAAFLAGADINRYGGLFETLENDYLRGDKACYPTDVNKAYKLITNFKSDPRNISRRLEDHSQDGLAFVQSGESQRADYARTGFNHQANKQQWKSSCPNSKKNWVHKTQWLEKSL